MNTSKHIAYKLGQVRHSAVVIKDTLRDDEPTSKRRLALLPLLLDALENVLKALHVIVIIPPDRAPRDLETLLNSEVHAAVCHDDIATLAESRNNRGDSRERLRVND